MLQKFAGCSLSTESLVTSRKPKNYRLRVERLFGGRRLSRKVRNGGPDGGRTRDLVNAIHARSQLRHWPHIAALQAYILSDRNSPNQRNDFLNGQGPINCT